MDQWRSRRPGAAALGGCIGSMNLPEVWVRFSVGWLVGWLPFPGWTPICFACALYTYIHGLESTFPVRSTHTYAGWNLRFLPVIGSGAAHCHLCVPDLFLGVNAGSSFFAWWYVVCCVLVESPFDDDWRVLFSLMLKVACPGHDYSLASVHDFD